MKLIVPPVRPEWTFGVPRVIGKWGNEEEVIIYNVDKSEEK